MSPYLFTIVFALNLLLGFKKQFLIFILTYGVTQAMKIVILYTIAVPFNLYFLIVLYKQNVREPLVG